MNYFVVHRGDELSKQLTEQFHLLAREFHMTEDEQSPDVVVSIGGDGTMLHAFHMCIDRLDQVSFVGIHTGHLGFFADWKADEFRDLIQAMAKKADHKNYRLVQYPIAEVRMVTGEGESTHYALNEFTLKGDQTTLVAQLDINDEIFETFRGDGICVSTPSGSTAYNKSLGGAVIHPSLETIQIAEISSINNRVFRTLGSSMILPKHHHCDIYPKTTQKFLLSIDQLHFELHDIRSIRCQVSEKKVQFVRYRPFPFWTRVREAFIGNDIID